MPITTAGWTIPAGSYEAVSWTVTDPDTGALLDLTQPGWSVVGGIVERQGGPVVHFWPDSAFTRTAAGVVRLVVPGSVSTLWVFRAGWYQVELTHPVGGPVRIDSNRLIVDPEINRTYLNEAARLGADVPAILGEQHPAVAQQYRHVSGRVALAHQSPVPVGHRAVGLDHPVLMRSKIVRSSARVRTVASTTLTGVLRKRRP